MNEIEAEKCSIKSEPGDKLFVFYLGMFENEEMFDYRIKRKNNDKGFSFILGEGNVIKGWDQVSLKVSPILAGVTLAYCSDLTNLSLLYNLDLSG